MTVQEDVMRTLDCCGYDHTEYMNKWVDDDTNVRTPSSGYSHDVKVLRVECSAENILGTIIFRGN